MEEFDMLSNKKISTAIHKLTMQYSQNLTQYRSFFGKLNTIEKAQYELSKKILKTRNLTKIYFLLQEECDFDGKRITTHDLLRKDSSYLSVWLLKVLLIIFTFPISLPLLFLWSQLTRGTLNFLKSSNFIIAEKIWLLSNSHSKYQLNTSHDITMRYKSTLNTTTWINNMLNMTEWHRRCRLLNKNSYSSGKKPFDINVHETDVEHGTAFDNDSQQVITAKHQKHSEKMITITDSVITSISSFVSTLYEIRKPKFKRLDSLEEAILNCETLLENINADLIIVTEALVAFNQEQRFLNNKMRALNVAKNLINQSILTNASFQKMPVVQEIDLPMDKKECTEMLRQYSELMNNYPQDLNKNKRTPENVESYYAALEEHHKKVLIIAECLVPELSSLLNKARVDEAEHALSMK